MESPRLTASGFIKRGTKFGPFHGIIKKTTVEDSQFVDEEGENYRLTLDKSKTPANQAWLAQLQSATSRQHNLRIFKEDKWLWCKAVNDIDEGQPLTAIYQSESNNMQHENTDATKVPLKRICVCQFCHIQFRNPANLQVHIQHYCQKVDISSSDTDSLQKPNENTLEFVCQLCRSTFSNHSNCETHMIKLHGEPESNLCKFCTYIASNSKTLTAHMFQQHVLVYKNRACPSTMDTTQEVNDVDTETTYKIKEEIKEEPGVVNSIPYYQTVAVSVNRLTPNSVDIDSCNSNNIDQVFRCKNCSFNTHLQMNFDQHECHHAEDKHAATENQMNNENNKETIQLSEDDVSSTTITSTPAVPQQQNVLSCTACNITFKSIRNFSAHKTYYCANRQFANDLYIAKLQKRQRVGLNDDESLQKRRRFYSSPTERSPEIEVNDKAISVNQSGHNTMPMLCLSRPTSKDSSESDHRELINVKNELKNSVALQEKPLDLSVKKSPPTSDQTSPTLPLVRPTSLDVKIPRAILLGYKCIECDIVFHKLESLKVHKQYYCATRHQPSPQRVSPIRNSPKNGALSRNSSKSPVSPGVILERDDSCSSPGKMSPDSIQSDLQRPVRKCSPSNNDGHAHCPSPLSRISQPTFSAFRGTRGEHGRSLSSPRQADRGSPGNATSPTSSQLGGTPQSAVGTMTTVDGGGTPNTLVMRYQTTPYHDTMVTSKDLQSSVSTGQRKIYCVCGAVFRNYDIYVAHKENYCSYRNMMSTSPALQQTVIDQPDSQNNDDDQKNHNDIIVCNICQNTFASFSDLKNHKCVSCVCPACPFVGSNLSQLQDHFNEHPGLLLDSTTTSPAEDKGKITNLQPIRSMREGAKRRKSTTPHAIHAKQAKLDEGVITSQTNHMEVGNEQTITKNPASQTRQSVITNIKPDPDNKNIKSVNTDTKTVASLELSTTNSNPASPVELNVTGEWEEVNSELSDRDRENKTSKLESNGLSHRLNTSIGIEAGDERDKQANDTTTDEDTMKSKKNSKSNAKLCRTCDLHFNNLSTFIAHRKYYCGASNQTTKT